LQQRIAPPVLATECPSSRSALDEVRKDRKYPLELRSWDAFNRDVMDFRGSTEEDGKVEDNPFYASLSNLHEQRNEAAEESYLCTYVLYPLFQMGLISKVYSEAVRVRGMPDFNLFGQVEGQENGIVACCECTSTQNLLVPENVEEICRTYRDALEQRPNGRTAEYSRVCHPVGQLMGYSQRGT
jgi:hypothetical protein